jgi:hypothetical protein
MLTVLYIALLLLRALEFNVVEAVAVVIIDILLSFMRKKEDVCR